MHMNIEQGQEQSDTCIQPQYQNIQSAMSKGITLVHVQFNLDARARRATETGQFEPCSQIRGPKQG